MGDLIGLRDLLKRIGKIIRSPGTTSSLLKKKSQQLGLDNTKTCKVGLGFIDAHAGGLGILSDKTMIDPGNKLAIISGTSACLMSSSSNIFFIPGIWGPYSNVMIPGFWLHESGITACGNLLNGILETHPFYPMLLGRSLIEKIRNINKIIEKTNYFLYVRDFFVYPDYHGNRNPLSDLELRGSQVGLTLIKEKKDLLKKYVATMEGLAF